MHGGRPAAPAPCSVHCPGTARQVRHGSRHSASQQYPSTHCPLWHWRPSWHTDPFPTVGTHAPPLHQKPGAHSASVPHPLGHTALPPEHTYGVQGGLPALPAPSSVHCPGTARHVSHASPHPLWQQYPSTHCPLAHCAPGCTPPRSPAPPHNCPRCTSTPPRTPRPFRTRSDTPRSRPSTRTARTTGSPRSPPPPPCTAPAPLRTCCTAPCTRSGSSTRPRSSSTDTRSPPRSSARSPSSSRTPRPRSGTPRRTRRRSCSSSGTVRSSPCTRTARTTGSVPPSPPPTTVHIPRLAARSQRSQPSAQSALQQYPSTHRPDTHSPPHPQLCPFPFRPTHAPPAQ